MNSNQNHNKEFEERHLSDLLKEYTNAAEAHGKATLSGDHRVANSAYERIASIYRELRLRGREAQNSLLFLLSHSDPAVRGWAASHALEFAPTEGASVLEGLAGQRDIWGLNATTTLKEWKKGTLKFP